MSYMNFAMGLGHHRVFVAQLQSIAAQNLKFLMGLSFLFVRSHAHDKTKKTFVKAILTIMNAT